MKSPFRIPTTVRIVFSKLGSFLLLFQKTPLVQILLPEARVLGTSGMGEVVKWSVAAIAGLGAFDTVAGATVISQVTPSPNSTTVPARTGGPDWCFKRVRRRACLWCCQGRLDPK